MKSIGRNMFVPLLVVVSLCLAAGCSFKPRLPEVPKLPSLPKIPKISKKEPELPAHVGSAGSGSYLFHNNCAKCHADPPSASFVELMKDVPTIVDPRRVKTLDQKWLYKITSEGGTSVGRRSSMPAFKDVLTEAEIRRIVSYLNGNPV